MSKLTQPSTDIGVIVGRFQVHELHEGQKSLIDTVREKHDAVLIFVGLTPLRNTTNDPLDFSARKRMIQEDYPDIDVYYIDDLYSDEQWSNNLDYQINRWKKPHQTVTMYGSRDSFVPYYSGQFPTQELESDIWVSGTTIRRRIANNFRPNKDFRAGVISASFNRYPTCFPTVDIAVIDKDNGNILLVKKPDEDMLRFPGGFASPESPSYEADARREVAEETGVSIEEVNYIGSTLIDDWRYRNNTDQIKTLLFEATYTFGRPQGADDVELAMWVSLVDLFEGKVQVMPAHRPLVEMVKKYSIN